MNILYILPYSPVPPNYGGRLRIYNLLRQMVRRHNVSVIFVGSEDDKKLLINRFEGNLEKVIACPPHLSRRMRRPVQLISLLSPHSMFYFVGANAGVRRAVERELERKAYDVVQSEFPHIAFFDIPRGPLRILDAHNIEYDNMRRMGEKSRSLLRRLFYSNESRKFRTDEIRAFRRQDLLLFTSERDRDLADGEVPEIPKWVIPNGVDSHYFTRPTIGPERGSMIFTGVMKYLPNDDGMIWFLDHVFPLIVQKAPWAKITIAGAEPTVALQRRASRNIIVTGYVDDVRPLVHAAEVSVVPLRMGGGTRLKILESLSMMNPVVTTTIGGEGIALEDGETALIADEPRAFADAVLRLFAERALRERLARNGFELMRNQYEWSVVGEKLELAYRDAIESDHMRCSPYA